MRCTIAQPDKGFNHFASTFTQSLSEGFQYCYSLPTNQKIGPLHMRLVCPNCDAEYEVDASAIPDGGRDVQCSNCGNAWFQMSPEAEAELAAEEALFDAPEAVAIPAQSEAEPALPEPKDEPEPDDDENPPPPPSDAPRRSIDESVLAVLREEAMRETEVRKTEAPVYAPPRG
jgi:predicted Zn finger-like uncharacterized protein